MAISPFSMIKSTPYYDPWKPNVPKGAATRTGGGMDPAALEALTKAKAYYEPGGDYGKGVEAGLERERTQAMSSGMQALVASGFAGTTMAGGLGKKFAEEVGMPTRARIEETRAERLSALDVLKAQLTQSASESAQQRALQKFIARMSSDTSLALGGMRQGGGVESPTMRMTSQPQRKTTAFTGGGLPPMTGAGAATYGIDGGMDVGVPTQGFWGASEQWRSEQPDWITGADELNVQGSNFIWGIKG